MYIAEHTLRESILYSFFFLGHRCKLPPFLLLLAGSVQPDLPAIYLPPMFHHSSARLLQKQVCVRERERKKKRDRGGGGTKSLRSIRDRSNTRTNSHPFLPGFPPFPRKPSATVDPAHSLSSLRFCYPWLFLMNLNAYNVHITIFIQIK